MTTREARAVIATLLAAGATAGIGCQAHGPRPPYAGSTPKTVVDFKYESDKTGLSHALHLKLRRDGHDYSVVFIGTSADDDALEADFSVSQGTVYISGSFPLGVIPGWPIIATTYVQIGVEGSTVIVQTHAGVEPYSHLTQRVFLLDDTGAHRVHVKAFAGGAERTLTQRGYVVVTSESTGTKITERKNIPTDPQDPITKFVNDTQARAQQVGAP